MAIVTGSEVWPTISQLARRATHRSATVPFVGSGAFGLMPMGPSDTLVVDCAVTSAQSGLTDPVEVGRYLDAGVSLFRCSRLHAKMYLFDQTVIVGSPNASHGSEAARQASMSPDV